MACVDQGFAVFADCAGCFEILYLHISVAFRYGEEFDEGFFMTTFIT